MRQFVFILLCFVSLPALPQELISPVRSDLIPPAPASSAMIEAQMPKPSLLTGAAAFSIPLYTVEADGFTMPITLQYHSNGVKVFDQTAPLGAGWSLTPALRATRTVMGRPDEKYGFMEFGAFASDPNGWFMPFQCMANSMALKFDADTLYDSQHDIFTFAIPGKNITRVIDARTKPYRFLGVDDTEYLVESDDNLDSITVTGPDGTVYVFGGPCEYQNVDKNPPNRTGWALNKIRLTSGRSVDIDWDGYCRQGPGMTYIGGASYIDNRNKFDFYGYTNEDDFRNSSLASGVLSSTRSDDLISRVKSISWPGGKVQFNYGGMLSSFISSVTYSNDDSELRTTEFSYRQTGYSHWVLEEVDTGEGAPYIFDYYSYGQYFHNPHSQDWWGYYNAVDNNTLEPHLKMHEMSPHQPDSVRRYNLEIGEADRSINEEAMKADLLKSIRYPTGATAEFVYETHRFGNMRMENGGNIMPDYDVFLNHGGGLRVKTVTMRNGNGDTAPQTVRYEYPPAKVRAVPSAATFVNVSAAAMPKGPWGSLDSRKVCPVRLVNVLPVSDYMRYDIGETPLWYDRVTEIHEEGKVEYHFKDMIPQPNSFYDRFGIRMINNLSKVFSAGPQLIEKNTYKGTPGNYEKIASERNTYFVCHYGAVSSTHINREMIMIGTNSHVQPDFDEGHLMRGAGPNGISLDIFAELRGNGVLLYSSIGYGVERQTERLVSTVNVTYHGGDSMVVRKEFEYEAGTAIVRKATTTCGGESRTVEYKYAGATGGGIAAAMKAYNIIDVPLRARSTRGGAAVISEAEYAHLGGRLFRPVRIRTWHEGGTDTVFSPAYEYLGHRLAGFTDADGVSSAYLWGYNGNLPVVRVDGADFAHVKDVFGTIATDGHAEQNDFASFPAFLCTKATYTPGVGMTSLKGPHGTTERYAYDSAGRLAETRVDGLGTVANYIYRINNDGDNSVTSYRWLDGDGIDKHATAVYYDYRGRPTESKDFAGGATGSALLVTGMKPSAVSVFSEYDAMGRLARTSVPSASKPGDAVSWTDYVYEPSPRGVRTAETKAGEAWKSGAKQATGKTAVNTAAVPWSCPRFEPTADGGVEYKGLWPTGALTVTETVDEDGHAVYEASDFEGRRLMWREGSGSDWLSTYYIYDSFGRLRRVLQPMLEVKSYSGDDAALDDFSFEYRYDGAGRCVYEHIPGVSPVLRRYSSAGRLVAEHLPAMAAGEWRLFYYDAVGRKVLEGVAALSDIALDSFVAASHLVTSGTDDDGTLILGYRHAGGFPDDFQAMSASYFDSYSYPGVIQPRLTVGGRWPVMHACGLPTGGADIGSDGEIRTESYYYDSLGRMIQCLSHAPEGNVVREMRHTYTGAVEWERTIVSRPDTSFVFVTHTEYDEGERPRSITYRLGTDSVTVRHTYNSAGLIARTGFGLKLAREYEYDIHGWPVKTATRLPAPPIGPIIRPLGSGQQYYSEIATKDTITAILRPTIDLLSERYVERMHYADGAVPRFTGEMSGRTTTFGSRYDYRYDAHDRLVGADYNAAATDSVNEDFSVSYTYDAIGRPLTLRRYGVTDIESTQETFGLLDGLTYSYDGALPSAIARETEATDFYGRTGAGATQLTFNAAGLLTADTGRSVTGVTYNRLGQPLKTTVSRAVTGLIAMPYVEENVYSSSGNLISAEHYGTSRNVKFPLGRKTHLANFTFGNDGSNTDTLTRVDFPWGYFDGNGVHWTLTDAIGSIEIVVDGDGNVEQHTGYYPYGEPWREAAGQPRLFGAKERRRFASLGDYDFHARFLTSATALWQASDPHAGDYMWLSPWTFCAANPIRYRDPSGKRIIDEDGILDKYRLYIESILNTYKESDTRLYNLVKVFFKNQLKTLDVLEASDVIYNYKVGTTGFLSYDESTDCVVVNVVDGDNGSIAHESNHAKQYDEGKLSIRSDSNMPLLYDRTDEVESYNIQRIFEFGRTMFEAPESIQEDGYSTKISSKDLDTFQNGYYSPLSSKSSKLTKKNRRKLIEINKSGKKPVEFYRGWENDL